MKLRAVFIVLVAVLGGCAAPPPPPALFVDVEPFEPPTRAMAQIVFLSPDGSPSAADANALFELAAGRRTLLAALAGHTGSFQQVAPGHHVFMSYGCSAHLLEADVEGGARYYVLLRSNGKGDLTPLPVRMTEDAEITNRSAASGQWLADAPMVAKTAIADVWFKNKAAAIDAAETVALAAWQRKSAPERAALTLDLADAVLR